MDKGENTKGLLDDFSLDDLEKELGSENLGNLICRVVVERKSIP